METNEPDGYWVVPPTDHVVADRRGLCRDVGAVEVSVDVAVGDDERGDGREGGQRAVRQPAAVTMPRRASRM